MGEPERSTKWSMEIFIYEAFVKFHLLHLIGEKTSEVPKARMHYEVQDSSPQEGDHLWKDSGVSCFMSEHVVQTNFG